MKRMFVKITWGYVKLDLPLPFPYKHTFIGMTKMPLFAVEEKEEEYEEEEEEEDIHFCKSVKSF